MDTSSKAGSAAFTDILGQRLSRRDFVAAGVYGGAAITGLFALSACDRSDPRNPRAGTQQKLGFQAVPKSMDDLVHVPAGYRAQVLYALGDPIHEGQAAYGNQGAETDFDQRSGDHHDGMYFFGLSAGGSWDPSASEQGILCLNHENTTDAYLHPAGPTRDEEGTRPAGEVRREMQAHGVSVIAIRRNADSSHELDRASPLNRRITLLTPMDLDGPAAGDAMLATKLSEGGTRAYGTLNNCSNGHTPWGTYLTCEENWNTYFHRGADEAQRSAAENTALARYAIAPDSQGDNYRGWDTVAGDLTERFDCSADGASAAADFRNEPNLFGWIVEIDPFDPAAAPRKHTAMGRFSHEGCVPAPLRAGKPVVFYMGDDSRFEYIYKFVSDLPYDPSLRGLAGSAHLANGTLYVARFGADGSGQWLPLRHGENGLTETSEVYPFSSQADVLVHTRLAADAVGATRMDRPEWGAVDPATGEVYFTLTNNSRRTPEDVDAANPRSYTDTFTKADGSTTENKGNVNGHIVRWREQGDDPAATRFHWDVYLFGAEAGAPASVNLSGLTDDNDLSSPDGLWFDPAGLLWIETDDAAYLDHTNCMLLAAVPGTQGDGGAVMVENSSESKVITIRGRKATPDNLRRFLVGPMEAEITGLAMTPDRRALFVNIQHPGENGETAAPSSHWPAASGDATVAGASDRRPRSATIVITREDGGEIAV
ncbi:PhoX family protein [Solimonas sp. K1W22B-7]|uniref:PhoX family protein n=1 Tax=Solimonas sp. K1W22B-7 TaxID=2303331 RepID=UPI001F090B3B|nr:PhoX family phosphatase [Solimonas sp. K1W22B-7]